MQRKALMRQPSLPSPCSPPSTQPLPPWPPPPLQIALATAIWLLVARNLDYTSGFYEEHTGR